MDRFALYGTMVCGISVRFGLFECVDPRAHQVLGEKQLGAVMELQYRYVSVGRPPVATTPGCHLFRRNDTIGQFYKVQRGRLRQGCSTGRVHTCGGRVGDRPVLVIAYALMPEGPSRSKPRPYSVSPDPREVGVVFDNMVLQPTLPEVLFVPKKLLAEVSKLMATTN